MKQPDKNSLDHALATLTHYNKWRRGNEEIKTCPFCGCEPAVAPDLERGENVVFCRNIRCPIFATPQFIVSVWNARTPNKAALEALDKEE